MRYVKATNTGLGFITHIDNETMSFSGKANSIWAVSGDDNSIDDWIVRVGGIERTLAEAQQDVADIEKFRYGRIEHIQALLTREEFNGILDESVNIPAIHTVLKRFMNVESINATAPWYADALADCVQAGILTSTRRTVLLAGK